MTMRCRQKSQGISLMGLLMALAITAILVTISLPSYRTYISKNKLLDLTRQLVEALYVSKQLAITRGQVHYLNFHSSTHISEGGGDPASIESCWVISAVQSCSCLISAELCQSYYGRRFTNVSSVAMVVNRPQLSFSPLFGKTNGATYRLALDSLETKVIVSGQGRIRVCMASGESANYAAC